MLHTDPDAIAARIPDFLFTFSRVFRDAGYQAVLVGGAIRDIVLGSDPGDFDFASDARPDQVMQLFPSVIPTGIQHGTVTVRFHTQSIEVTTFRIDGTYTDQRRPDSVAFSDNLEDDLQRRDFTMNALAVRLPECSIIDTTGGLADIQARCIRAIGNPHDRFAEDSLRIWRGLRFASRLGFHIEPCTLQAMQDQAPGVHTVAAERIREEWIKLLQGAYFDSAVTRAAEIGILDTVLPFQEISTDELADVCTRMRSDCTHPIDWQWRYACLLTADCRKQAAKTDELSRYLQKRRYSRQEVSEIMHKVRSILMPQTISARRYLHLLQGADYYSVNWARYTLGLPVLDSDQLEHLDKELNRGVVYGPADLSVTGKDLIEALDQPPGPWIGDLLARLVACVVEHPELNTTGMLLDAAKSLHDECT